MLTKEEKREIESKIDEIEDEFAELNGTRYRGFFYERIAELRTLIERAS